MSPSRSACVGCCSNKCGHACGLRRSVRMSGERDPAYQGALTRFERLRRVVVRYELGEISHDEFTTLKQQVLLGQTGANAIETARIGLLVAAYASPLGIDSSLDAIRALPRVQQ